ncbi:MAG: DUF2254 domain-containing protein [Candidatus Accumulibacter meliphilus]|jgi:uncharacterized membrane protein|uniref:DUF2254 domain-containing protein n=1 Tax=Candidatus Accumulibacter meliphilus TaxID=2211374 RepID=A0A369XS39_9PROT|nr:MAG: DUF2254 domain-containing protein [Candidatus Accumulibacter meliphilus]
MGDRLRFLLNRIGERLWVRPLAMCVLSTAVVFLAKTADDTGIGPLVPAITTDSIETLLNIIAASMLVISTFAVASMVSAYASASSTATPRSFSLVISDDVSQNALSTFIGAFIFSIIALIALQNGYYDRAGRFALFSLTLMMLAMVVITFVTWVDRIARLGRLGETIDKVEAATADALQRRRCAPTLRSVPAGPCRNEGRAIYGGSIGYVQRVDVTALQTYAEESRARITVAALPGTFSAPGRALAYVTADSGDLSDIDARQVAQAFILGNGRQFDEDPRFGLVVLSEIASRALSPAVNDPGTAIGIIGTFVRLFALWSEPIDESDTPISECDRVEVPKISLRDMFDDAFTAIARDGAGTIEVAGRLQKAFASLASIGGGEMRDAAIHHSRLALARAENVLEIPEDLEVVRKLAKLASFV